MLTSSFYKLRDESWGIKIREFETEPVKGEVVKVVKRSGETSYVFVDRVVARFDDAILCAIVGDAPAPSNIFENPVVLTFEPTIEQRVALDIFLTGESLAIEAGAGTGKTSTLTLLAAHAHALGKRGQYVAFNSAIVADSAKKFPASVECNTAHSLAVRAKGAPFFPRKDAGKRMKSIEIARILKLNPVTVTTYADEKKTLSATFLAGHVINATRRFCQSADPTPTWKHFPYIQNLDAPPQEAHGPRSYAVNEAVAKACEPALKLAWSDLCMYEGQLPFTVSTMMAVVLKLWQLSEPKINADYILFDEAQDASPVMVDVIRQQTHAQIVWVGDSNQQIYSFTGAINALANVAAKNRAMLTQSFRFGQAVADVANEVLATLPTEMQLQGFEKIASVVEAIENPKAVLTRTNATAIRAIMAAIENEQRPFLVGGGKEIATFCRAAADLMDGVRVDHPELACFENWAEVEEYVENDEQGNDLRLMVKLINDFGVEAILEAVNGCAKEEDADLIVSTAHKAKGREWDSVRLGGDFPPANKMNDEERRLLYVAVTRAKLILDVTAVEFFNPAGLIPAGIDGEEA